MSLSLASVSSGSIPTIEYNVDSGHLNLVNPNEGDGIDKAALSVSR